MKVKIPSFRGADDPDYLTEHILTEAIPAKSRAAAVCTTDPADLERTANKQRQSALLRLPIEIRRRIYNHAFEDAGLTRHVYVKKGRYTHTACITDHDAPDERQAEMREIFPMMRTSLNDPIWSRRLLSSWSNHWRCEEAATARRKPIPTPFMGLLLCCKRT